MTLQRNGADARAHLEARVRELELALALLARRWEQELVPRLLELEQDVDELLELVRPEPRKEE